MDSKQLAEAHWDYISSLLGTHGEDKEVIEKIKFHYITAFIHGYKHCEEQSLIDRGIYE